jgi:hypothetical protein
MCAVQPTTDKDTKKNIYLKGDNKITAPVIKYKLPEHTIHTSLRRGNGGRGLQDICMSDWSGIISAFEREEHMLFRHASEPYRLHNEQGCNHSNGDVSHVAWFSCANGWLNNWICIIDSTVLRNLLLSAIYSKKHDLNCISTKVKSINRI